MANRKVFYGDDARKRLLGGAKLLYDAVKTTLGPIGENVVVDRNFGGPTVTHDGVTVAKNIEYDPKDEEMLGYKTGVELIKTAASKMNDLAGDGTTTVTILTYHLLDEANKLIAAGYKPMLLRRELEKVADQLTEAIDQLSTPVKDNLEEVATISAGDPALGQLVAEVVGKVGKDGVVTVEESQGLYMESDIVEGYSFDRGYVSPYMVTDTSRMEAVMNAPAIVVTDRRLGSFTELVPLLEKIVQAGKREVVFIAEDVEGDALASLILNKLKGQFTAVAVKAPSFGDRRKETLEDIAILTGAQVITEDQGYTIENADLEMVGTAAKVIINKDETTIIKGDGTDTMVEGRLKQLTKQAAEAKSEYDKEGYEQRKAALEGRVAVIKVGGATETEIEEKKFRVDDAVAAAKAALEDGVVPGGEISLINAAQQLKPTSDSDYAKTAVKMLQNASEQPFRRLLENAGLSADTYIADVKKKPGYGVNVLGGEELVDLKAAGVVDPTKVLKEAVKNAVSIAGTGLTMGALIVDIPADAPAMPPNFPM